MRWPREPCSDCLTRLSASWLWAEVSVDNVCQIHLPRNRQAQAHVSTHFNTNTQAKPTHKLLCALCPNCKQFRFVDAWECFLMAEEAMAVMLKHVKCFLVCLFFRLHKGNSFFSVLEFYLNVKLLTWIFALPYSPRPHTLIPSSKYCTPAFMFIF